MNRKMIVGYLLALLVATFAVYACNKPASDVSNTIKMGTILGLTGPNADYGIKMQRGFEFALDEINTSGGVNGKKVELQIENSEFNPTKAVTAYQKLHGANAVNIIVGITGSKNAIPVCNVAKSDNVVIIDALGSAPMLTNSGKPNYFRVMASDALAGKYNVDWALASGMKKPVIVFMEDDWGTSYRDAVVDYLQSKGLSTVPVYGEKSDTRDFRLDIQKIKAQKPDAVFLLLYANEGATFMKQLREAGIKSQVYGSDNISNPKFVTVGSEVVEGVRVALPAPVSGAKYDSFLTKYKSKYNETPDANVIKSYDALKLAVMAVKMVGENPSTIRQYLHSKDFEFIGISGPIKFDKNGDLVTQQYTRMVYRAGELIPLK